MRQAGRADANTAQQQFWKNMQIAAPCTASWDEMSGDDKSRFCQQCQLNVYNLSVLTESEVEALLASRSADGRMCVRFYRRADGTVLTDNCPVGLRRLRDTARTAWRVAAAVLSCALSWSAAWAGEGQAGDNKERSKAGSAASKKATKIHCKKYSGGNLRDEFPDPPNPVHMGELPRYMTSKTTDEQATQDAQTRRSTYNNLCQQVLVQHLTKQLSRQLDLSKMMLKMTIDRSGRVVNVAIVASCGDRRYDQEVLALAKIAAMPVMPADITGQTIELYLPLAKIKAQAGEDGIK